MKGKRIKFNNDFKSHLFRMVFKHPTWNHGYNTQHNSPTPHVTPCLQRQKKKKKKKKIKHTETGSVKKD